MARTFLRQLTQIAQSDTYDDTVVPSLANYETNPSEIEADLNSLRSRANDIIHRDGASFPGNWYDLIATPSTFENGTARGVDPLNQDLHDLERKRILDRVSQIGLDVVIGTPGDQYVILPLADLPGNTTIAVGAVTTLGTVAAFEASFGTATLTEVAGPNAIRPLNLCMLWYASGADIGDPVVDASGEQIYGLLQSENASDGFTATGTTPNRLQLSFVTLNGTGDDLILAGSGEMDGVTFDYAVVERFAFQDLPEYAFLGTSFVDSGVANATRQAAYDNQGTTDVEVTTNSTLDLNSAGIFWQIRDLANAGLFRIEEGSTGGTTTIRIMNDVDAYYNTATDVQFGNGVRANSLGTRPIELGDSDGVIETTAGDLMVKGAAELLFDDVNQTGSTWAQDGIKLSDTTAEWDNFETAFGEVSLLAAIVAANSGSARTKVQSTLTSNVTAGSDVNGPGFAANCDTNLPPYNLVTFNTDVDVMLNGNMLRHTDDVIPGTSPTNGDLEFTFNLKGTGTKPDQLIVIVYGQ